MTFLIRLFVKDYQNVKNPEVRSNYGKLASVYGILLNVILFAGKLIIGTLCQSVAIRADAFNNLSDVGSSTIALASFIFSSRPADEDHPFGHERLEYIFSMIVAFIIMFFGIQLIMSSFEQIFHPEQLTFNVPMIAVLMASIVIKMYMYLYNKKYGKLLDSTVMRSTAVDSISDVFATSVILIGLSISYVSGLQLDGYLGIVVALLIMKGGYSIVVETFNKLIGEAPDPLFTKTIIAKIMSYEGVLGVHDLIVHTYGPGKTFVTVHVEVSSKDSILKSHNLIDQIEKELAMEEQINVVIHMDPVDMDDMYTNKMRHLVSDAVASIDSRLTIHDFRIVKADSHHNFIFDVKVPSECKLKDQELVASIHKKIPQADLPNHAIITIDRAYIASIKP